MPKIDIASVPERKGSLYPAPFHEMMHGRIRKALGDAGGLTQFGVNMMRLPRRMVEPAPLAHRRGRVHLCAFG